jgi:hypothetical protein
MLIFRTLSAISKLTRRRALFLFLLLYVDRLKAQLLPQPLTHDNVIKPTPSQYSPVLKVSCIVDPGRNERVTVWLSG